ncbi:MAG: hypothetical protein E7558_01270 [Ruminococcaceae bacterium]|nr:hypothetical protein [Oscillospiraceae bacterium]
MENKSMSTKKKLAILAGIIATIFIGVNLAWFIGVWMPYNKYTENMELDTNTSNSRSYVYEDKTYIYRLNRPSYLFFNAGFFSVEKTGAELMIFIYPESFEKGYTYRLDSMNTDTGDSMCFFIDSDLKVLSYNEENPEFNDSYKQFLNENYVEISLMLNSAIDFWGLE